MPSTSTSRASPVDRARPRNRAGRLREGDVFATSAMSPLHRLVVDIHRERLDPAVEIAAIDFQEARCCGDVSLAAVEGFAEDPPLGVFTELAIRERSEPGGGCAGHFRGNEQRGRVGVDDERTRIAQKV